MTTAPPSSNSTQRCPGSNASVRDRPATLAARLLAAITADGSHERVARGFMFTDIVKSTDLIGLIGDEAWEDLLRWHDQMLGAEFSAHGGTVAHHTGDGFFVTFDDAASAFACAIGVQRALVDHRRDHGFAPLVRIGVHVAEATRRGADYSGGEVHKAARIAALADGGEIVASVDAIRAADHTVRRGRSPNRDPEGCGAPRRGGQGRLAARRTLRPRSPPAAARQPLADARRRESTWITPIAVSGRSRRIASNCGFAIVRTRTLPRASRVATRGSSVITAISPTASPCGSNGHDTLITGRIAHRDGDITAHDDVQLVPGSPCSAIVSPSS